MNWLTGAVENPGIELTDAVSDREIQNVTRTRFASVSSVFKEHSTPECQAR